MNKIIIQARLDYSETKKSKLTTGILTYIHKRVNSNFQKFFQIEIFLRKKIITL